MRRASIVAGLLLMTVAIVLGVTQHSPARRGHAIPLVNVGRLTPGPATHSTQSTSANAGGGRPIPPGTRLELSRLHVAAPITDVAAVGGVMQIPRDPHTVGWWTGGAEPGDAHGTVVIVGHINYAGVSGALSALPNLRPGDSLSLLGSGYRHTYRIVAIRSYPKTSGIPANVFSRSGTPRLVLITCGGDFDSATGNYDDNIVAYADVGKASQSIIR
jgi:hypothetical protein